MDRQERDAIDAVFRKVERFTSVGATTSALEQLTNSRLLADDDLLGWPVLKLHTPSWWRKLGDRGLDTVMGYPNVLHMVSARTLAGLGLVLPGATRPQRGVMAATMCGTAYGLQTRMRYGLDGSDHLAFVNFATSAMEKLFPNDHRAREALVLFLAAQSCFSYATSGAAKLISPVWRDGSAIPGIFRTTTYGDPFFHSVVQDRPWLSKAIAWGTIAGELAFPLALVAPKPVARGILASGAVFHLANARFMGLNRFVWSFCATYPAIAHVSRSLGSSTGADSPIERSARAAGELVRSRLPFTAPRPAATETAVETAQAAGKSAAVAGRALLGGAGDRPTNRRVGKAVAVGAGAVGLAAAGVAVGTALNRRARAQRTHLNSAPGELVSIDGRSVHVMARTQGEGPTVVFESGMACPLTGWSWVLDQLGPDTPYVAYDRPGTGWSQPASGPQDAERAAAHLGELLERLGAKPPYVLVGQSVGGLLIRSFARRHPESVAGMVFVDSSHPDQLARSPRQRQSLSWLRQRMTTAWLRAEVGKLPRQQALGPFDTLPEPLVGKTVDCMRLPNSWRAARQELAQWQRSWSADSRLLDSAPSLPVAVVTAGRTADRDPVHHILQAELAALSPDSYHELVEGASHEGLTMEEKHAGSVVRAIDWARGRAAAHTAHAAKTTNTPEIRNTQREDLS